MSKNPLRLFTALLVLLLCPLDMLRAGDERNTSRKPNILLILSDDMCYGDIGAHGCTDIPTPNIDRTGTTSAPAEARDGAG
jgi:hypothetical protein